MTNSPISDIIYLDFILHKMVNYKWYINLLLIHNDAYTPGASELRCSLGQTLP